jgi:gamma-glutamyltranspeptidase
VAGKRPAHTLAPCTVFEERRPKIVIGTMGGSGQPQILQRLSLGYDVGAAIGAPRWALGGMGANDSADEILVEARVPHPAREALAGVGSANVALPPGRQRRSRATDRNLPTGA